MHVWNQNNINRKILNEYGKKQNDGNIPSVERKEETSFQLKL